MSPMSFSCMKQNALSASAVQFLKHTHQLTRNRKQATCITPIYSYTITESSKQDKFWSGKTGCLCPVAVLHAEALSVHWVACGFWFGLQRNWIPQCCRALSRTSIYWELEFYSAALRLIFLFVTLSVSLNPRNHSISVSDSFGPGYGTFFSYRLYSGCSYIVTNDVSMDLNEKGLFFSSSKQ